MRGLEVSWALVRQGGPIFVGLLSDKKRSEIHDGETSMHSAAHKRAYRLKSVFLARFPGVAKQKSPTLPYSFLTTINEVFI
jgi:hypothetical protein